MHRMGFRRDLICGTVADLLGSDAAEARVLDIGCNNGFFSLDLADRGVGHVQGVDLRTSNIAQALFLRDRYGVENVEFAVSHAHDIGTPDQWDVVLNLGVLYHVVGGGAFPRANCKRPVRRPANWRRRTGTPAAAGPPGPAGRAREPVERAPDLRFEVRPEGSSEQVSLNRRNATTPARNWFAHRGPVAQLVERCSYKAEAD
jgi:SAM-dependent methyltransferase